MRRRRQPEEALREILDAGERLIREEGPSALTLKRVAAEVGMSHVGVLHHVGNSQGLVERVQQRAALRVRDQLLEALGRSSGPERTQALEDAMARLGDPENGRILAWLVSTGADPFPPVQDQGLQRIDQALHGETRQVLLLACLAMAGEAVLGGSLRARLGLGDQPDDLALTRRVLLGLLRGAVQEPPTPG